MITIEQCNKILNKGERKYNNEEIKMMREYLYILGGLQLVIENNDLNN